MPEESNHVKQGLNMFKQDLVNLYILYIVWQMLPPTDRFRGFAILVRQAEGWSRTPDAVIAFGAPRLADQALSNLPNPTMSCPQFLDPVW